MKKLMLLATVFLFINGCGLGTVKWRVNDPKFQAENQPIREVRIAVFNDTNCAYPKEVIRDTIQAVSDDFEKEVGIVLKISYWEDFPFASRKPTEIMSAVRNKIYGYSQDCSLLNQRCVDWDIAVCFTYYTPIQFILANTVGGVMAVTDDKYRRFIIVKELTKHVLKHEICHCFIFKEAHSWTGIEMPMMVKIAPLTPPIAVGGSSLTPKFREEFLKNKWRDFDLLPDIPQSYQKDIPGSWKQTSDERK